MKIVRNNIIPFKGFMAINLFGVLFVRNNCSINDVDINHEAIHTKQMKELCYIFFYVLYALEWLIKISIYWNSHLAYRNISFEQEAYLYEKDMQYLENRRHYNWLYFII